MNQLRMWLAALIATLLTSIAGAPALADCRLAKVAEFPVVVERGRILIPSEINGHKVYFIFDTGGMSMMFSDAARRLGVPTQTMTTADLGMQVYGIGGQIALGKGTLKAARIGTVDMSGSEILVGGDRPSAAADIVGIIGYDVFARYDLEFDLEHKMVRLLKSPGCSDDQMDYWRAPYAVAPLEPRGGEDRHSYVDVRLNGARVEAMLDTGSPRSMVTLSGAARAGIRINSPGVQRIGSIAGMSGSSTPAWAAPFNSFSIGEETIAHPTLAMADMFQADLSAATGTHVPTAVGDTPGMLVGLDFFLAHRVLVSREHQKVYFSYGGGPIFKPLEAQDRAANSPPLGEDAASAPGG